MLVLVQVDQRVVWDVGDGLCRLLLQCLPRDLPEGLLHVGRIPCRCHVVWDVSLLLAPVLVALQIALRHVRIQIGLVACMKFR